MRRRLLALLPLVGVSLAGCAIVPDVAGFAVGGAAGGATANPAIGYVVGLGVRTGVAELRRYVVRRRSQGEQDAIAEVAGTAPLDQSRPWEIRHTIPIGNESGTLTVVREIVTPLATCREVVFRVDQQLFTTPVCRQASGWKWAAAEPAVERWGFLQ